MDEVIKSNVFACSEALLERALRVIPLGTQTFSKSITQFPRGVSPFYVTRAQGSRVWDADGNEFIDFISALNAVTLGYGDPDVNSAVASQLEAGSLFSLPHPIEIEVAEAICEMVPCAEMVRFGKNGTDATSAAVRLARAFTGRDHVIVCGYHGWQDWYIGSTTRDLGVPAATKALTHVATYNDIESFARIFDAHPAAVAAVVLEAAGAKLPLPGFLESLKELVQTHGALLVFDETITGFRLAQGGAQELFGVVPDLATFGKGLANGFPLSAIAGRRDVMMMMERIFFSGTFGGETLSLAAAAAVLAKLRREPVIARLKSQGQKIVDGVRARARAHGIAHMFDISGDPSWSFLTIRETPSCDLWQVKTLFLQEMFARGILILFTHNMTYAHSDEDIATLLGAYEEVFGIIARAIGAGTVADQLRCAPLAQLFKVR